ncbi:MAG TPA: archease [Balneolaceae bacterium]|nr:archease [Balneolaceae bacterium]
MAMTGTHEILPHTADLRMRVTADTIPGLFQSGLEGLNQVLLANFDPRKSDTTAITKTINLESPDTTSLLIDFLSEVLTLSQIYKTIFHDLNITTLTAAQLRATITGQAVGAFDEDVKAVTYHEAEIKQNNRGKWETIIVYDI